MSIKIKDPKDPTKEIEVFTEAEVAAREATAKKGAAPDAAALKAAQDAAIEEYKKNNPDQSTAVEKLKNDLAQAQALLEAAEGMNGGEAGRAEQIARLRKERDDANTALTKTIGELSTKITTMETNALATAKNALLDRLVGANKENREKVLLEFDKYNPSDTTPAGLEARMTAAVAISGVTVEVGPSNMDMAGGQGGQRGTGGNQGGPVKVPDNAVKIGTALGVKPEELQALADKKAGKTT